MPNLQIMAATLEPGAIVKLFHLDLHNQGGGHYYYHPYTQLYPNIISFQGYNYQPFAFKDEGWDWNTKGTLPRPVITIANIGSAVTNLLRQFNDFIGCEVTRHRTYTDFLDDGPTPDPTQEFPPDIFVVDRKRSETNTIVELELSMKADAEGKQLPGRQIIANFCMWKYRDTNCGYAGPPLANDQDDLLTVGTDRGLYDPNGVYNLHDYVYQNVHGVRQYYVFYYTGGTNAPIANTSAWRRDLCGKRLSSCRLRFGGAPTTTRQLSSFTNDTHGTGYAVGDVLTAIGGTFTTPVTVIVDALGSGDPPNHVASFANGGYHISNPGNYTVVPPNPVQFLDTTGSGTGFALNIGWSSTTITGGILPTSAFPGAAKVLA
jgi:lambda family phage minor tail protein L